MLTHRAPLTCVAALPLPVTRTVCGWPVSAKDLNAPRPSRQASALAAAVLQILFTYVGPAFGAVAWWTHIAGFVIGIVFALLAKPAIARRLRN